MSKAVFYRSIDDCDISVVFNHTQMFFRLRLIAREQQKRQRVETISYIMAYATAEQKDELKAWLIDYFHSDVRMETFDLDIDETDGTFIYGKQLEKAIKKIKRKR